MFGLSSDYRIEDTRSRAGATARRATAIGLAGFLLSAASAFAADDFYAGRSAYNLGDYKTAMAVWLPRAKRGEAKAQASVAWLYLKGLGVPVNYREAFRWYRKAALTGQPESLYFMGTLYLLGHGVARDHVRAYVACELALSKGIVQGLFCRDTAAESLTDTQRQTAERMVARWYKLEEAE